MKPIPMRFRFLLFLAGGWALAGFAVGQTSDENLPSAPSATVQENAPAKQPPANDKPPAPTKSHPQKPVQELKPGDSSNQSVAPPADSAKQNEQPAASASPGASTTPTADAAQPQATPGTPRLEDPPKADATEPVAQFSQTVNEVRVIFTVTDKHGRYIKDLKRNDFRVVDDRKPADAIRSFRSETDLPLQVGLLIDASNSIRDRFKFEQEAAIEFLNSIIRPRYD